jgi:hypothetical protein
VGIIAHPTMIITKSEYNPGLSEIPSPRLPGPVYRNSGFRQQLSLRFLWH